MASWIVNLVIICFCSQALCAKATTTCPGRQMYTYGMSYEYPGANEGESSEAICHTANCGGHGSLYMRCCPALGYPDGWYKDLTKGNPWCSGQECPPCPEPGSPPPVGWSNLYVLGWQTPVSWHAITGSIAGTDPRLLCTQMGQTGHRPYETCMRACEDSHNEPRPTWMDSSSVPAGQRCTAVRFFSNYCFPYHCEDAEFLQNQVHDSPDAHNAGLFGYMHEGNSDAIQIYIPPTACEADCQTCSDPTTCNICENEKFLHNGKCITSCPAGYASLGSDPGKFCQAYGCTTGPDEGCADCVSQELRINDASCSSCNDETYGYYVDVNDLTCRPICVEKVCTCPVGMHGSTTLVGDASFGGCHISPTSIDAWVIKMSDEDDAVVYDEISSKITVTFEKSGGRTHQLSLFKVDCTTEVPDNDLLKLVSANGQLAGVNIDDLENEFLHMEIDVDLTKMESTSLRDTASASGKVDFCVRADLKDSPGANAHGVNFIRARMSMEVNIVASIQEVAVKLESTDTDISMGPDDALTHVIELDACQCDIDDLLESNDRCVASDAHQRDVSIDSPPKLTPSDRLSLCISTQTDVVEIHEITNLKLTQPSNSGGDSTMFDVIEDSIVSGLASYDGLDKQIGHIHRVRTNLVNIFFKNTGSGTVDQSDVTVSGTAKVLFKPSRRLALANVVIKRSLQEQEEREGRFSMTIALRGNEDVEAPASTVAPTDTTEALATAVASPTTAEASIALASSTTTTTTTLLWGYEVKSNMKCKNKGGEIELIIPDGTENLEHFCASKCNITGSCVGFVSKDKEAICGLRLRSMYAPTQKYGMSCYVRTGQASVQVTMRVENIEHSFLMANESLLSQFVERVQRVVAQNAGNGVSHEDVEVFLSPGSIVIEASVHAYSGLEPTALHRALTTSVNILGDLVQSLQSIPGIASVSTGAIAVSNFQAAHRSATTPSDQTPMSKDSDEFDWVFFILIPGATLMFVLCLLCCAIWALRLRKQHRKEEDDGQLVNVNDEESQKQEPSKAMTPSPSSATAQTPKLASTTLAETDAVIFVVDSNDQAELRDVAIVTNDSI